MRKLVLEITPQGCGHVFEEHGKITEDTNILFRKPKDVALVVFTGGEDVWPELYGENTWRGTGFNAQRDLYEGRMFELARENDIPMVGICRGSQFLCVKAGHKLIQDVRNHGGYHTIRTNDGRLIQCNSTHHQMQLPGEGATPLAWAEPRISTHYINGDGEKVEVDREHEVVYYPNINAVGIQFHPEWSSCPKEGIDYAKEVVNKYLFNKDI